MNTTIPNCVDRSTPQQISVNRCQFLNKLQLREYTGPINNPVPGQENFAYAIADPVPTGRYWAIMKAVSVYNIQNQGNVLPNAFAAPGLFITPSSNVPPSQTANASYLLFSQCFFQNAAGGFFNAPTTKPGTFRIDDWLSFGDVGGSVGPGIPNEVVLNRRGIYIPQNYTLILWAGVNSIHGGDAQFQVRLKLWFAELYIGGQTTNIEENLDFEL